MDYKHIRALYSIEDILKRAGVVVRGYRTKYCLCPLPQHRHSSNPSPSFTIWWGNDREKWMCHGQCDLTGDVIDLIGYMEIPGYKRFSPKLYRQAAEILTGNFSINPPVVPPPTPLLPNWLWEDTQPPSNRAIEYALSRGITQEQIAHHRLGTPPPWWSDEPYNLYKPDSWLTIPTFHGEELMGIKMRNLDPNSKIRYMSVAGSRKGLFNWNAVYMKEEPVLVVKGEIAAMVAEAHGFLACAPTSGESGMVNDIRTALLLANVIVVGDNDANPETRIKMQYAAEKRAAVLGGIVKFPPEQYKDIDEWLLAEKDNAVRVIRSWEEE